MAKPLYKVGDRVECVDKDGRFYGTIVGRGPRKTEFYADAERLYDIKREDGIEGCGVKSTWRITAEYEFGGKVVRKTKRAA